MLADIELAGKTAIVTGGYSGIGLETTRALAAKGTRVIVPVRSPEKAASALAEIAGEPMIQRVWRGARRAKSLQRVIVATDDERIAAA